MTNFLASDHRHGGSHIIESALVPDPRRAVVTAEAVTWLRTPFVFGAAVKGRQGGVDCGRLVSAAFAAAGIKVPEEIKHFPHDWHLNTKEEKYLSMVEKYATPVTSPGPGDMVMFRLRAGQPFSHAAIVFAWPKCIHARASSGRQAGVEWIDLSRGPLAACEKRFFSPFLVS